MQRSKIMWGVFGMVGLVGIGISGVSLPRALAEDFPNSPPDLGRALWFQTVRHDTCNYWTDVRVDGRTVYACIMRPRQTETPESLSLEMALDRIDQRLQKLEARLQTLEQQP